MSTTPAFPEVSHRPLFFFVLYNFIVLAQNSDCVTCQFEMDIIVNHDREDHKITSVFLMLVLLN